MQTVVRSYRIDLALRASREIALRWPLIVLLRAGCRRGTRDWPFGRTWLSRGALPADLPYHAGWIQLWPGEWAAGRVVQAQETVLELEIQFAAAWLRLVAVGGWIPKVDGLWQVGGTRSDLVPSIWCLLYPWVWSPSPSAERPEPPAGFDVVGSPAELQAEVPGRPPKTTGTNSKCEGQLRTRSRCLTGSEARRPELGPWPG
jgi:hypothetical protein